MKRLLSFLIAALMLLCLCACGKKPADISIECDGENVKKLEFDLNKDYADEELTLTAVLEPAGAKGEIEWESSDKSVVKVKDSGDGSCLLILKDLGKATVTASCGELEAKVKITVENDAEPEAEPAPEQVPEAETEPEAEAEPKVREFTVAPTENSAGLPFTPNDVYASNIFSALDGHMGKVDEAYRTILSADETSSMSFTSFTAMYSEAGGYFKGMGIMDKDSAKGPSCSFVYLGANIEAVEIYLDAVDGNISSVEFVADAGTIKGARVTGFGGDRELNDPDGEIFVENEGSSFTVSFNGSNAYIEMDYKTRDSDNHPLRLTFRPEGNSVQLTTAVLYDEPDNSKVFFDFYDSHATLGDVHTYVICCLNGEECGVIYSALEKYKVFSYANEETDILLNYYFKNDEFDHSFFGHYSTGGFENSTNIDADGNIIG